jgi:hypothetical protein
VIEVYYGLMLAGAALLAAIALFHHQLFPLERGLKTVVWRETHPIPPPPSSPVDFDGERVTVRCRDGATHAFGAEGLRLWPGAGAVIELGNRRLLALLDSGDRRRTYLVDVHRASQGGTLEHGLIGWWRHGTGELLAVDGPRVVEAHRTLGHDRLYWIDPLQAAAGHGFGMGLERTLVAPVRNISRLHIAGREIVVVKGDRAWRAAVE